MRLRPIGWVILLFAGMMALSFWLTSSEYGSRCARLDFGSDSYGECLSDRSSAFTAIAVGGGVPLLVMLKLSGWRLVR